jgi:hypothetical protein
MVCSTRNFFDDAANFATLDVRMSFSSGVALVTFSLSQVKPFARTFKIPTHHRSLLEAQIYKVPREYLASVHEKKELLPGLHFISYNLLTAFHS